GNGAGAGIAALGNTKILNSTISGNHVTNSGGASGSAIVATNSISIANTTISGNQVQGSGGGDATILDFFAADVVIVNSTIAGNTGGTSADCRGPVSSQGYSLIGDATGCSFAATTGDRTGTSAAPIDPLLAPLTQSGGPTTTRAPLAGSPLLDSGNPAAASDA